MKSTIIIIISTILSLASFSISAEEHTNEIKAAEKAAIAWLKLVDQKKYEKSWDETANLFKAQVKKKSWPGTISAVRNKVGTFVSRTKKVSKYMTELPGAPKGKYVIFQFSSSFKNHPNAIETITPMLDNDGKWHVSGYFVK